MKNELIKRFLKKTVVKIIVFAFIMVIVSAIFQAMAPVVTNEMAMTQMENSNEMFIMMETYNKLKPLVNTAYSLIVFVFICTIIKESYKFIRNINNDFNKEN